MTAAAAAGPVIPVYVLDDETPKHRKMGGASRWWLHHSLESLTQHYEKLGLKLVLRRGAAADVLAGIVQETGAAAIHFIRHYEPWWRNAERDLAARVTVTCHDGNYLLPPGWVRTGSGEPYKIYTPFWRALSSHMPPPAPLPVPDVKAPDAWPASDRLEDWGLLPTRPNWAKGFADLWTPGERGAAERLKAFVGLATGYDVGRNLPSDERTSRLSPHLHFGEISPATIWHALPENAETYRKELVWRDYAQNVILQMPDYGRTNGRGALDALKWRTLDAADARADFSAWTKGRTGYPIVDAGMRQLWVSGWMHNRVRMIAASFLVKHLLIDWREGDRWFWDTLVDADYASNAVNWQWVAGTGIDSNMFTRIMAPLSQSEKFDSASYIRRWVPELTALNDDVIHDPHGAGVAPRDYPAPLIGHREGRERALAAYAATR